jgi:DnaJ domain
MTTMAQSPSTFNGLCACGCGASVKPGQRWREPACKARAYRARQRAERTNYIDTLYDELMEEQAELEYKLKALEEAYSLLWKQHENCRRAPPVAAPQRPGVSDAYAVLGVRADAELEAIEGAYRALAKKYHPDRRPDDRHAEAMMRGINRAYDEIMRLRGQGRKRR